MATGKLRWLPPAAAACRWRHGRRLLLLPSASRSQQPPHCHTDCKGIMVQRSSSDQQR